MRLRIVVLVACLLVLVAAAPEVIRPAVTTDTVGTDPDDPAIWVNAKNPDRSLVLGTDKAAAPYGTVFVFGLDGKTRSKIEGLDRPNNVDVSYGLILGKGKVDIAVVTERGKYRLRVYRIDSESATLTDIGEAKVFEGEQGERAAPMGIALYRRSRDGATFAIVSRKTGPDDEYLWQYLLLDDGKGRVRGQLVRKFGKYSGTKEIEAVMVDSQLGYVYYSDERFGIRKYYADPDHADPARELAVFGKEGFEGDREGIALYAREDGTGYIICTDQKTRNTTYRIYRREGTRGNPNDHSELIKVVRGGADSTDGIEAVSVALGARFPDGMLVAMNSRPKNFLVFNWDSVAEASGVQLRKGRK
jgi:3-phytase